MNRIFRKIYWSGRTGIIIAVVVVVTAVALCFGLRAAGKEPIKIGAILSLTGPGGYVGIEVRDGMRLAVDEVNSWGGIDGRKIELIIEDSKTNRQEGMKAFNRIDTAYHPLLYVSTLSHISLALAPLSEKKEVVLVGLVTSTPELTAQKKWVFRYYASAEYEARAIISILKRLKIKSLGILYVNDEYGRSLFEIVKRKFETSGGLVRSEAFGLKEENYKGQITRLKEMESICAIGHASQFKNIFEQLKELDFGGFILGSTGASSPIIVNLPEVAGAYVTAPIIYNPNYIFAREAGDKYEAKYHKPFTQFAANGYDFVKLLASLLEDKDISRKSVKGLLEGGFIYPGIFGDLDVEPGEHDIVFPLHPARIMDGEVKYLYY